jgi:SAM-dependent methyltransferase
MSDAATLAWYEREAPYYTASGSQGQSRHLDGFLARLSPGAAILELGCGGGRDAAYMIEHGFTVDPTDGTAAMVRKANERHNVGARQMRFDELNAHSAYDAIWAHASLLHCPRANLPSVLHAIHTALKHGGLHFANFKLGDAEHPNEGRDPLGRWTNLPSPEWLEELYRDAAFEIITTERYRGNGSDGVQRDWLALTVKAVE